MLTKITFRIVLHRRCCSRRFSLKSDRFSRLRGAHPFDSKDRRVGDRRGRLGRREHETRSLFTQCVVSPRVSKASFHPSLPSKHIPLPRYPKSDIWFSEAPRILLELRSCAGEFERETPRSPLSFLRMKIYRENV